MKGWFSYAICLLLGSFSSLWAQTGGDGVFSQFEVVVFGKGAAEVSWTVAEGQQCYDVEVQRSLDGEVWTTQYVQAGLCGGDTRYAWLDQSPELYRPAYYRLETAGGERTRPVLFEYRFLEETEQAFIFPHPIHEIGYFTFPNPNFKEHTLELVDLAGKSRGIWTERESNTIELNRQGLESGTYIYLLRETNGELTAKGILRVD